ncbi:hypothetical protein [Methylobacterium durans]|uniref:Uncharacterized protein n=1 Tax=Methylobacterium durans TaxID=2202825 RepID=A0A2U8WDH3_9HYPH|nr:hypothetical protein [Methylobacterium durans]AWN43366.1 hypothetical protein DK389_26220 [Methylobacterium durans]
MMRITFAFAALLIASGSPFAEEVQYYCAEEGRVALAHQGNDTAPVKQDAQRFSIDIDDETVFIKDAYTGIYRCAPIDGAGSSALYCRSPDHRTVFTLDYGSQKFSLARLNTSDAAPPFMSTGQCSKRQAASNPRTPG